MTTRPEHERDDRRRYRCADCGKLSVARITADGNAVVSAAHTGCGRCGGEHFVPYETADIDASPSYVSGEALGTNA